MCSSNSLLGHMNAANVVIENIISFHNELFPNTNSGLPAIEEHPPPEANVEDHNSNQHHYDQKEESSTTSDEPTIPSPTSFSELAPNNLPGARQSQALPGLNETAVSLVRDQWRRRERTLSGEQVLLGK